MFIMRVASVQIAACGDTHTHSSLPPRPPKTHTVELDRGAVQWVLRDGYKQTVMLITNNGMQQCAYCYRCTIRQKDVLCIAGAKVCCNINSTPSSANPVHTPFVSHLHPHHPNCSFPQYTHHSTYIGICRVAIALGDKLGHFCTHPRSTTRVGIGSEPSREKLAAHHLLGTGNHVCGKHCCGLGVFEERGAGEQRQHLCMGARS